MTVINIDFEQISCDLCNSNSAHHGVLAVKDKYGYPVNTVICKRCGNIFINPRPTYDWYSWFYNNLYDKLVGRRFDKSSNYMDDFFEAEKKEGKQIHGNLMDNLPARGKLLDVGCSLGGIASAFREKGWEVYGIDTMEHHIEYAREHVNGIFEVITAENFESPVQFDLIIVLRTLNHMLSPSQFLRRMHEFLKTNGSIYIKALDARFHFYKAHLSTQIDHPYLLSQPVLQSYLAKERYTVETFKRTSGYLEVLASTSHQSPGYLKNNYPTIHLDIYKNTLRFILARLIHKLGF